MHRDDARMVERGEHTRLVRELTGEHRRFHLGREHLERDVATEHGVGGAIDAAHPAAADVFGLGAILGALLRAPGATVPKPLRAIITRASEPVAANRYAGADALADDVRRWLDAEPVSAYREPAWERIARLYQRHQALVLLLATYLGVRVLIFVWRRI